MNSDKLVLKRIIPLIVIIACIISPLMSGLSVVGQGYHPPDDANRHVAKVISGKEWKDILIIREDIKLLTQEGWDYILTKSYKILHLNKDRLLVFSIVSLFLIFTVLPMFFFRYQESWIIALLIFGVFNFNILWRLFLGRPFIFTMAAMILIFFCFQYIKSMGKPLFGILIMTLLISLATWIHGSWFLFSIPLMALFIAREWRLFLYFLISMTLGLIIGSFLVGEPLQYMRQSMGMFDVVKTTIINLQEGDSGLVLKNQLVTELRPFAGESAFVTVILIFLIWRKIRGDWDIKAIDNPIFITVLLGWLGGFLAARTWSDWGWTALVFWVASEIDSVLSKYKDYFFSYKRLMPVAFVCSAFFLLVSSDLNGRWSTSAPASQPIYRSDNKKMFPEKGGVLYSDSMSLFYRFFYDNPNIDYKFILGFEPTLMPKEDLKTYRELQLRGISNDNLYPWIRKMSTKDRLVIMSDTKPNIEGLIWDEITSPYAKFWSGRKELKDGD